MTALASLGGQGSFAARRNVPASALRLEVGGLGPISLPISKAKALALCRVARPAQHGYKDQTRLDVSVRDSWEIEANRIKLDERRWRRALDPALSRVARDLGIAADARIQAELHNLLVYAPGQFFVPHQDSEKSDAMIGTLVATLPSEFTGGGLIVQHHDEERVYRGSRHDIELVAFYADCRHEVRPVKSGYRIVLTYNLTLSGAADRWPLVAPEHLERLEGAVREFFRTTPPPRWRGAASEPPDRLVYLLDHQYTQKGLTWGRLKEADAARAAALREVARRLDCEVALALADVHESWSCTDEYVPGFGYGNPYDYDEGGEDDPELDDGADDGFEGSGPVLTDLIESSVQLRHFVDASGKAEAVSADVPEAELCFTKPSDELDPFRSEHEGYMGNWGNTVDRWYHRAAVVLWPRSRTFTIRAKASARWAMREIAATLTRGQTDEARRMAADLAPFWQRVTGVEPSKVVAPTLRVVRALDDRDLAAALIRPFRIEHLASKGAAVLDAVAGHYGLQWFRDTCASFVDWDPDRTDDVVPGVHVLDWICTLPAFVRVLCATRTADGDALAQWIVSEQWRRVAADYLASARVRPSRRLTALERFDGAILGLAESALACGAAAAEHARIVDFLTSDGRLSLALVRLLRTCTKSHGPRGVERLGIDAVRAYAVRRLETELSVPVRADADWSIAAPRDCSCALCQELARFLVDRSRTRHEWPLAQQKRAHVHHVVDDHEIPVTHRTRRSGRPFTLVLQKTRALFDGEAKERAAKTEGLAWLRAEGGRASRRSRKITTN